MDKATELLEALVDLENDNSIDEHAYFHTFSRKVHARQSKKPPSSNVTGSTGHAAPLTFSAASKAEEKAFGKGTILNHSVNNGITTHTHVLKPVAKNPGAFEHHFYTYHKSGANAGQIKSHATSSFTSQSDAEKHATNLEHEHSTMTAKKKAIKAVTGVAKKQIDNIAKKHAPTFAKHLLNQIRKSVVPF